LARLQPYSQKINQPKKLDTDKHASFFAAAVSVMMRKSLITLTPGGDTAEPVSWVRREPMMAGGGGGVIGSYRERCIDVLGYPLAVKVLAILFCSSNDRKSIC
jgi:hypothetical protein